MIFGALLLAAFANTAMAPVPHEPVAPGGGSGRAAMHSVATVSDPMSHGVVGDGLLSLNEAIQLHNRTLLTSQLSQAEITQLSGFGADIAWVNIDATWTSTITVERDLDVILDLPHGLLIQGFNGSAVIDFSNSNVHSGFRSVSNFCSWRNLILQGGTFGVDLQQTDASFGGTVFDNVAFDGQSQFAFSLTGGTANGYSRVLFDHCDIRNTPFAIRCDEQPTGRTSIVAAFHSAFQAGIDGVTLRLGNGGTSLFQFDSVRIDAGSNGLQIARYPGSDRPVQLASTHLDVQASNCVDLEGSTLAPTAVELRMLDLRASVGGTALRTWPLLADIPGVIEDSRIAGDTSIETGGGTQSLRLENCRMSNGAVTLGGAGNQGVSMTQVALSGCNLGTSGTAAVAMLACSVVGGSVQGSQGAPLQVAFSFLTTAFGPHMSVSQPLPAAPLGSFQVQPRDPAIGGSLTIQADLPPGLVGIFAIGPTADTPLLLGQPLHVYMDPAQILYLPGIYRLQQGLSVPIPLQFGLVGTDWVVQSAVVPDPGVLAPDLQLPPGRRFVLH